MNEHPNHSHSIQVLVTSFHAVTQHFDNIIVQDSEDNAFPVSSHEDQAPAELQEQHQDTEPVVDFLEYPQANSEIM